ncbi:hypothetical protein Rhopal_002350-T1 [Rhodotorula paludigena]|uniref:Auxin efflux carrier n=1 Tax=Rhodotorula paludigena TaxID=86838 RepID=A0AAV5GIR2_9BASI|nr:hypothetical protein Rhopal_002350-T1 [Rhodotorula paludigena]
MSGVFLPDALAPVSLVSSALAVAKPGKPAEPNPLPTLIGVVVESAVGWFLAHKGIVDAKAKKTLNKINTSLFTPCLLFNKVAFSLTPDKLADLYIIPIGFCIISAFSAGVAYIFGRLVGLRKSQRNFAIACATFQNSNSLPIALLQSLIGEKLPLTWGPHDSRDAMLGRGLSYLVLFSSLGIIVRWSIGVRLMTSAEGQEDDDSANGRAGAQDTEANAEGEGYDVREDEAHAREGDALLQSRTSNKSVSHQSSRSILKKPAGGAGSNGATPARTRESTVSAGSSSASDDATTVVAEPANGSSGSGSGANGTAATDHLVVLPSTNFAGRADVASQVAKERKKRARIFQSFPNTPIPSVYSASEGGRDDDDDDESDEGWNSDSDGYDDGNAEWGARRGFGRRWLNGGGRFARVRRFARRAGRALKRFWAKFSDFMTVPLWAAVLSLVVACIPPLQSTLNKAEPLKAAIRSAGSCSVPITLVTLGAYFYRPSPAAAAETSPLRREEQELPPHLQSPRAPLASFSRQLLRRIRQPFAPLPQRPGGDAAAATHGEKRTILVSVVTRMIIVPAVLIPLFALYAAKTVNVADDPVFVVVACLLIGSPTAITLAQITSSAAGPAFERLISRTLFVSYAFLTAPTTIILVLAAIWIDGLQHPHTNGPGQQGGAPLIALATATMPALVGV